MRWPRAPKYFKHIEVTPLTVFEVQAWQQLDRSLQPGSVLHIMWQLLGTSSLSPLKHQI